MEYGRWPRVAEDFEVRRIHNDLTFIDEFLTLYFVREQRLFKFGYNRSDWSTFMEIETREFPKVKRQLLASLTNMGRPQIAVRDGNYKNRGELYLEHTYAGDELQSRITRKTHSSTCKSCGTDRCISRPCWRTHARCYPSMERITISKRENHLN